MSDNADPRAAYSTLLGIAADLACGHLLPDLPDGKRCGPRRITTAVESAADLHRSVAQRIRVAADALRGEAAALRAAQEREQRIREAIFRTIRQMRTEPEWDEPKALLLNEAWRAGITPEETDALPDWPTDAAAIRAMKP
jgi:hypothetical protein